DHDGVREHQWVRSVCSLRRHNSNVDVVLCLYGGARPETLDVARRSSVHVERMGDYAAALGDLPTHWRAALSTYPPLQKFVSLCHFASTPLTRLLYVDCDTYFFADPATLLARYSNCQWYGREEPSS